MSLRLLARREWYTINLVFHVASLPMAVTDRSNCPRRPHFNLGGCLMAQEENHKRGMVVVAHPDDAEYGCAGTVAQWCRNGMEVVYVVCTDGSKGSSDPDVTVEHLKRTRRQEQLDACDVLGVKEVVFLDYEDAMLQPTLELRRDITREIRRHKPDVVICQSPTRTLRYHGYVGHPDHYAAGEAAISAIFPAARDRLTFPELLAEGLEPHNVAEVMVMGHDAMRFRRLIVGSHESQLPDLLDSRPVIFQALVSHADG